MRDFPEIPLHRRETHYVSENGHWLEGQKDVEDKRLNYRMRIDLDHESAMMQIQMRAMTDNLATWVFDTREQLFREGLIKLGWTPPEEKKI